MVRQQKRRQTGVTVRSESWLRRGTGSRNLFSYAISLGSEQLTLARRGYSSNARQPQLQHAAHRPGQHELRPGGPDEPLLQRILRLPGAAGQTEERVPGAPRVLHGSPMRDRQPPREPEARLGARRRLSGVQKAAAKR